MFFQLHYVGSLELKGASGPLLSNRMLTYRGIKKRADTQVQKSDVFWNEGTYHLKKPKIITNPLAKWGKRTSKLRIEISEGALERTDGLTVAASSLSRLCSASDSPSTCKQTDMQTQASVWQLHISCRLSQKWAGSGHGTVGINIYGGLGFQHRNNQTQMRYTASGCLPKNLAWKTKGPRVLPRFLSLSWMQLKKSMYVSADRYFYVTDSSAKCDSFQLWK